MARPLRRLQSGPLVLVARHPALVDLAAALVRGLEMPGAPPVRWREAVGPITVHVGVRDLFNVIPPRRGLRIGIQTEQFFDHEGRALWGQESRLRLLKYAALYDHIIELSAANASHYAALPAWARRKIHVGPWIFPRAPVSHVAETDSRAVFFGTLNARRRDILAALNPAPHVIASPTFGDALDDVVRAHRAVLNIHYQAGVYAEFPRLLLAYLAGKPVMSEPLGPPMVPGRDYVPLGETITQEAASAAFAGFSQNVAGRFRFVAFLAAVGACAPDQP